MIAALVLWPTIQIAEFSFQNYGLPQLAGSEPTQWVGFSNYSQILHDPEFWLSLRLSVLSAAVFALTFLGTDTAKFTLPIYVQYFYGRNGANWGAIMAASTLFTIPVMAFFLIVQRRLAAGLVAGAVKG